MKTKYVGVKLKDTPFDYRLLLRLVILAEWRHDEANLKELSEQEGGTLSEGMKVINDLIATKKLDVIEFKLPSFKYELEGKLRDSLAREASSYRKHLAAKAGKPVIVPPNPPLPPIDPKEREKWLGKTWTLASKLAERERYHIAYQLAGCVVRIGLEEVKTLVKEANSYDAKPETGAMHHFFSLYCAKRDALKKGPSTKL